VTNLPPERAKSQGRSRARYFGKSYPIAASTSKVRRTAGRATMRR
jgi:hypothetical protein